MNNKIKYSGYDYIVMRNEIELGINNIELRSFSHIEYARKWLRNDVKHTLDDFNKTQYDLTEMSSDYALFESDCGTNIEWELRKIHHRVDGDWDNPNEQTKWEKVK